MLYDKIEQNQTKRLRLSVLYQNYYDDFVEWEGKGTKEKVKFAYVSTDHNYVTTNRLKIIEGRNFSEKPSTDSSAVLLNRSAAKQIGYDNPIGRTISFRNREWTISLPLH